MGSNLGKRGNQQASVPENALVRFKGRFPLSRNMRESGYSTLAILPSFMVIEANQLLFGWLQPVIVPVLQYSAPNMEVSVKRRG